MSDYLQTPPQPSPLTGREQSTVFCGYLHDGYLGGGGVNILHTLFSKILGRQAKTEKPEYVPKDLHEVVNDYRQPETDKTTLAYFYDYHGVFFSGEIAWLEGHVTEPGNGVAGTKSDRLLKHWDYGDAARTESQGRDIMHFEKQFIAALERIQNELKSQGWQETSKGSLQLIQEIQGTGIALVYLTTA